MEQTYKYRVYPSEEAANEARRHINICRQVYNHSLGQYRAAPDDGKPSYTTLQNRLPTWKKQWPEWSDIYSKCLQMTVQRLFNGKKALRSLQSNGYDVGELKWKSPSEYRSIVYNQFGFDVDSNTDRADHAILRLAKIGEFEVRYHRPLPSDACVNQVVLKEEKSGKWYASVVLESNADLSSKPDIDSIDPRDTVGIDVGITKLIHDSDGRAVTPSDESGAWRRIERRHRELSRKQHGSNNWDTARQNLAAAYEELKNRREDLQAKLASWYTRRFDAVFLEDIHARDMLERYPNSKKIASMSWRKLISMFQHHGEKNGCHVLTISPEGTTKECAQCGVSTKKPLWVREHSCPSCGFVADRDQNAALVIQRKGLNELGIEPVMDSRVGMGDAEETPVETVFPTEIDENEHFSEVSAKHVIETGSLVTQISG